MSNYVWIIIGPVSWKKAENILECLKKWNILIRIKNKLFLVGWFIGWLSVREKQFQLAQVMRKTMYDRRDAKSCQSKLYKTCDKNNVVAKNILWMTSVSNNT